METRRQSSHLANAYLVYVHSVSVSEVMSGHEKVDESGIHSFLEDIFGDDLTDEILPASGASVETEDESLGRLVSMLEVTSEIPDNVVDDQMLAM